MNRRFVGVLLFAFVVASGASLMLYRVLANRPAQTKSAPASVRIAVASRDLELGSVIREGDVTLADWPGAVPAGASARAQDLVGRGVITPIYAKEPVLENRIAPKGAGGGLAAMIPNGMRAVAIRVNEVAGVAGFVVPGMRVDVLISGNPPSGANAGLGTVTKTMLQNLEVLSAGQDFKKDAEGKPVVVQVVNLLVTPEQAEQLSLASSQTSLQLILRNPLDRQVSKTSGAAMAQLFTGSRIRLSDGSGDGELTVRRRAPAPKPIVIPPAPPKKEEPFVMEILNGAKRNETKFSGEGK